MVCDINNLLLLLLFFPMCHSMYCFVVCSRLPPLTAGDPGAPEPGPVLRLAGVQHRLRAGELHPGNVEGGSEESQRRWLHRVAGAEIRHRSVVIPLLGPYYIGLKRK